ncbi:MAG: DoxX family membrane protein [Chitinophagales bacterium]
MFRRATPFLMGVLYIAAGLNHFWHSEFYSAMMPPYIPYHDLAVTVSGIAEVVLGLGVIWTVTRRYAAAGIILLLLAVFPANIHMAIHHEQYGLPLWGLLLRLPMQFLLMYWAYTIEKE